MKQLLIIFAVLSLSGVAAAQDDADEPETLPSIRVRGATVHAAARFLAEVHEVGVWVAAPEGTPLSFEVTGTADEAFRALSTAAHLGLRRRDQRSRGVYWVAEENRLLRAESANVRGLSGGRRIDLNLEGVEAVELAGMLGAVSRVSVRGVPLGALTVCMRGARSTRALEILARLADARVSRRGREVSMRLGSFPDWPARPSAGCEASGERASVLRCASFAQLRLIGLAPERALVAAPGEPAAILHVGSRVGAEGWRVAALTDAGLELTRGEGDDEERRTLALGEGG